MKKYSKKFILSCLILLISGTVFYTSVLVRGQVGDTTSAEIDDLTRQIKEKRDQAEDLQQKQEAYSVALKEKQAEKADLTNQLAILDNQIAEQQLQIESLQVDVDRTNLEIKKTNLEIIDKQEQMDKAKEHVAVVLKLLYKQDRANALEILLMNNSFSEFMNQVKYLEDVNGELSDSLTALQSYKDQLDKQKTALEEKTKELAKLMTDMTEKKVVLDEQKNNKNIVLEQTKNSEQEYQNLINQLKQQQNQAAADVVNMERLVRQKLSKSQNKKLELNPEGLMWPVTKNTITTYFHDPNYPFRYLFEHPGVDIRAAQGTPIRAAASGYVGRAKDGGMGYSYIMIVHADGLATVYGHVSKIMVNEDDYVVQGQVIGMSGATPGTPGAGPFTTGPHLHFEVRLNGIPVNPMEYLP